MYTKCHTVLTFYMYKKFHTFVASNKSEADIQCVGQPRPKQAKSAKHLFDQLDKNDNNKNKGDSIKATQ